MTRVIHNPDCGNESLERIGVLCDILVLSLSSQLNKGSDWHYEFGERHIHSFRKSGNLVPLNSSSHFSVNVRVGKQFTRFSSMKPVPSIAVVLFLAAVGSTQPLADPNQILPVNECANKESSLVYEEKGDVTVAVLLDLTQGPLCIQKNAASMQSMNGILQTFQTLNSIQYLKGLKIGIRIFDTCGQESIALQAVLQTALEANLTHGLPCRVGVHLGFLFPIRSYPAAAQLLSVLNLPATDISFWQTTSPLDAVSDLLIRLRWSSIAVIILPHFQANSTNTNSSKYVLVAADNWNSNFTEEVAQSVQEALIIRPQRVLTDDNVSARVLYSLIKQFKNHLSSTCRGKFKSCDLDLII
ncbi:hypothetical protein DAPPUDRAFT_119420 [Daphnia pulex]|uniref:Receptor ligand binding region domain-containing protein n=1 Tax=Daphnia pulex TaxID=6669 RepID=E9HYH1_DAPPU|nr:hypothetical protein DAPPUDRAFT_119420 [Daphnia pulex]|eukprot:EFX63209.1 hypothetical protein DAPPUDRAFT_119420 [Daphnia pulex]